MSTPSDPYDLLKRINAATGVTRRSGPWKGPGALPSRGQSRSSLIEDFGRPDKVDVTVTKSKRKEVLKFFPAGSNRYKLKVTVEDGVVTGWESKG
jgi:hypothetical protein